MIISYDLTLIVVSVAVSIIGSHTTLAIVSRGGYFLHAPYKMRMVCGAITFGGSIWAMHFIGMLALHLPVPTFYAVVETLASALMAIVVTGLGLYVATSGRINSYALEIGAILMGAGIVSMHYLGMSGIRSTCIITYSYAGIVGSTFVAIGASWLAMRIMTRRPRLTRSRLWAAVLLGVAISGMHYVAMAGTTFSITEDTILIAEPVLDKYYIAILVLVLAFLIVDVFLFIVLPEARAGGVFAYGDSPMARAVKPANGHTVSSSEDTGANTKPLVVDDGSPYDHDVDARLQSAEVDEPIDDTPSDSTSARLAIKTSRGGVRFLDADDLLCVAAEGHYTSIVIVQGLTRRVETILANHSFSKLLTDLPTERFFQVHRSYAVNIMHVKEVMRKRDSAYIRFIFDDAPQVPVSRSRLGPVLARLTLGRRTDGGADPS